MNFTGVSSSRRRTVNLGNKKQQQPNTNFLQQAKLQRQQREEQRTKERAAKVLQKSIQRYLDRKQQIAHLLQRWQDGEGDLSTWLADAVLLLKYSERKPETIHVLVSVLYNRMSSSAETVEQLPPFINARLVDGLADVLPHASRQNKALIFKIWRLVHFPSDKSINALYDWIQSDRDIDPEMLSEVVSYVFQVAWEQELDFATFIRVLGLNVFHEANPHYLTVIRDRVESAHSGQVSASKVMTKNFFIIHGNESFTGKDFKLISMILPDSAENNDENDIGDDDNDVVGELYSLEFLRGVVSLLQEEPTTSLAILSTLLRHSPAQKQVVFNMICARASNIASIFHQLVQMDAYSRKNDRDRSFVSLFQELVLFWLIVSNDSEFYQALSREEVVELTSLLKSMCLKLLNTDIKSDFAEVSFNLLTQIYQKNLRLEFLPTGFWIQDLKINVDKVIVHVRDSLNENDNDDDDDNDNYDYGSGYGYDNGREDGKNSDYLSRLMKKMPYTLPFYTRAQIFQGMVDTEKKDDAVSFFMEATRLKAKIRREHLLEDAFSAYAQTGSQFKNKLSVEFHNQYGLEAGIDGGGITKEFLTCVLAAGFDPEERLFSETFDHQVYPTGERYEMLYFLGMCVGKCLYENVLLDVPFATSFLNKWTGHRNTFDELQIFDPSLYQSLKLLAHMPPSELENLNLNFMIDDMGKQVELVKNGQHVYVTKSNVAIYVQKYADYKLNRAYSRQTTAFLSGVFQIIPRCWFQIFDAFELQKLISGEMSSINRKDWRDNSIVHGFEFNSPVVDMFWQLMDEFSDEDVGKLLAFVTSSKRAPLLGFSRLEPKFGIQNKGRGDALPSSSTCINLLKIPEYSSKEKMREKILYAINAEAGFDLS
ncbi:uncharacterized protein LODBEIA_P49210 [Lodderomyces beijingensis]|uniref:HECT-type E3 ubiquitin transferase n=1 Tax=Lodderomyces beijingensis TaxID=1775926 RepID=A0ABP0ZVP2_9ASCO